MIYTEQLIKLIESEEQLRINAVTEALDTKKSLKKRAEDLKEIMYSLADEDNTPWFSFSIVTIVFDTVNWETIINHFEGVNK